MRAMRLDNVAPIESNPLHLVDAPDPVPGPGEVRVKIRCCAICRTDLHTIEGELPSQRLPVIPGHQAVGLVDQLGPGCTRLTIGARVGVAWLRHTCGVCRFCTSGRENLCPKSLYTGYHADGGYAQYTIVPEGFAYEIPTAFSDAQAAPLLCAGIIGYRAMRRANLPATGGRVALIGFGSSAHVVLQLLVRRGRQVYVVSRTEGHRRLAIELGAKWAGDDARGIPDKVDAAILFAPAGALVPPALESLERGGTLALAGIHMTPIPSLDYQRHLFNERDVHAVTANTRDDGRELLAEAARVPIAPHTVRYDLADANRALRDMKEGRIDGTGVLVL
jgi:propanol-preferring alcohol dehydrogenase